MFHSSEALAKKTPAGSLTRPAFLQSLVDEYQAKDTSPGMGGHYHQLGATSACIALINDSSMLIVLNV